LDCPKGELDKKKFTKVYQEFFPRNRAEKFSSEVFKLFDNYLLISFSYSFYLKRYDSNQNGRIDKKEMITMLNAIYDLKGIENRKGDNDPKGKLLFSFVYK